MQVVIYICLQSKPDQQAASDAARELAQVVITKDSPSELDKALRNFLGTLRGTAIILFDLRTARSGLDLGFYRTLCPDIAFILMAEAGVCDKVLLECFESGIDDFIPPSIASGVLEAKLRAFIRRMAPIPSKTTGVAPAISATGLLMVDKPTFSVLVRERNHERRLTNFTSTEFKILTLFAENSSIMVERRTVLEYVWGNKADTINPENVDKHIGSIRKKLGQTGRKIKTIYGGGYMLCG